MMRRAPALSRDKSDTLLLLASSLLVLVPHAAHLPPWVSALCMATLLWRAAVTLLGRRMPPSLVLMPIAGLAMFGVLRTYHTLLGRDAGVAMLVLLVAFKMLEMHAKRDLYVVVFLCLFLALTNFFYSQTIGTGIVMLASVALLLTTLVSFQFTGTVPPLRKRLGLALRMLACAAPLGIAMFVLFPRVPGPLWGMPGDAAGHSGLSDKMAPGQMSKLAQSRDTAFRVRFDGAPPPQSQLYWRGPVLGAFDGTTWTRMPQRIHRSRAREALSLAVNGHPVRYQVTLEPSNTRWLFALEMPEQLPDLSGNLAFVSAEFELTSAYPIETRTRYAMSSYLNFNLQGAEQPDVDAGAWLLLPYGRNPRALEAGQALRREPDPGKRVGAVLRQFAREHYVYTLEPPLLGSDSVDEFLYATRAGFCEHFAGAFVYLMRAAGVPARVVTGYQGGELNPVDGYVTVRQSDAHAWAEVWLGARGWVRIDPTAVVAPERVRSGLREAIPPPAPFGIEGLGRLMQFEGDPHSMLARLRFTLDAVNNGWNQWVLNYTPERQRGLLERLRGRLLDWRTPGVVVLACALLLALRLLRKHARRDPVDALYSALCQRLDQLGLPRAPDEGPTAYAARVAAAGLAPAHAAAAAEFLRRYSAWRYAPARPDPLLAATLKRLLLQLR
jgi:transglutaminase-like putative cysteine protease